MPMPSPTTLLPLSGSSVLRLSGRDAIAFAQAQFANDVTALTDGQWQWSLWLSAKGRVIALFALLRLGPEELIAWLPDFPAEELSERLTRFRFRSKVVIEVMKNMQACGAFATPADLGVTAAGWNAAVSRDQEGTLSRVVLEMSGQTPRVLVLDADAPTAAPAPALEAAWRLDDVAHGLPRLAGAQIEAFTPQMLGLERFAAFSVKKGCYPGQEIVARTHFLGQAKRSLVRLALNHEVAPGTRLKSPGGSQAEIVCIASDGTRIEALAVAPVDSANEAFSSEDGATVASTRPMLHTGSDQA